MANNPTGHMLAADAIRRYPDTSSVGLARLLYAQNNASFINMNAAYCMVRQLRGSKGVEHRERALRGPETDLIRPVGQSPSYPVGLPKQAAGLGWESARIDGDRFLCISDIHLPYHDVAALKIAIQDGKRDGVDAILINGDLMDAYQLSKFAKNPTKPNFSEEVKMATQFLRHLRNEFPKASISWKFGNHDLSLERYLWTKAPEIFDCPGVNLEEFVKTSDMGVNIIKDNRRVMMGRLTALHGHEWGQGSIGPVNPARGAFLKLSDSAIIGHFHRTSQHSETTLHEKLISCWSTGCLCRLHPEYARINKWNHGYAFISVDSKGNFEVNNRRIYHGRSW